MIACGSETEEKNCGLLFAGRGEIFPTPEVTEENGLFYATLVLPHTGSFRVALHGVTNRTQALQAASYLAG